MTWVKLDDGYPEHLKVVGLSDKAFRADIEGWCYCARTLSDGLIPTAAAKRWSAKAIAELVAAGRWHHDVAGYRIHDYLDYNPSRERVLEDRRLAAERQAKFRRSNAVTAPEHLRESHDPGPVPDPNPSSNAKGKGAKATVDNRPDHDQVYLDDKIAGRWEQEPIGFAGLQKLNNEYGRPAVTSALRQLHGFPPATLGRAYGYVVKVCRERVAS